MTDYTSVAAFPATTGPLFNISTPLVSNMSHFSTSASYDSLATFTLTAPTDSLETVIIPHFYSASPYDEETIVFSGTATITATGNPAYGPVTPVETVSPPGIFPYTVTVADGQAEYLDIPQGNEQIYAIITGPTTFETTFTVWTQDGGAAVTVYTLTPEIIPYTQTLDEGTQIIEVPYEATYSDVTLLGPTTYVATFTGLGDNDKVLDGTQITDAHCSQTATFYQPNHTVTYVTTVAILTAGQTLSTVAWWIEDTTFHTETFTGPTTILFTTTAQLSPELDDPIQMEPIGRICDGICGACSLYFPSVYVYYWPVASPNTACLTAISTIAPSQGGAGSSGIVARPRALRERVDGTSTLVSNGFTLYDTLDPFL